MYQKTAAPRDRILLVLSTGSVSAATEVANTVFAAERRTSLQEIFQNEVAEEPRSSPSMAVVAGVYGRPNQVTISMKSANTSAPAILNPMAARVIRFLSSHASKQRTMKTMTKAKKKSSAGERSKWADS
jgi:hypothetical protein